jgi:hypothetical protein
MKNSTRFISLTFAVILLLTGSCSKNENPAGVSEDAALNRVISPNGLAALTPISVYGAWHAGNDYCTWGSVRNMADFDVKNHWLIDRGNGQPSVNLVVLSFVNPLKLLNQTTDNATLNGVPRGMTPDVVNYFKSKGVRVMLSIGGITYVSAWDQALASNATQLGLKAATLAQNLGVGIEIDYEQNSNPKLMELQSFINAYRSVLPYDPSGVNHAARLTIDLAAGDRWLIDICRKATKDWLSTATPVLDYANAMVASKQFRSAADAQSNWQEHIDGKAQYAPPILPLAPAKFTGSLYLTGNRPISECINFNTSLQKSTGTFVQSVASKIAGTSSGMLGYMFWAAECPGTRSACTTPPNSCEGGVGAGAAYYNVPIPMPALRQQ